MSQENVESEGPAEMADDQVKSQRTIEERAGVRWPGMPQRTDHLVTTLADFPPAALPSDNRNMRLSGAFSSAGGRTRTCDTRIMIPLL